MEEGGTEGGMGGWRERNSVVFFLNILLGFFLLHNLPWTLPKITKEQTKQQRNKQTYKIVAT